MYKQRLIKLEYFNFFLSILCIKENNLMTVFLSDFCSFMGVGSGSEHPRPGSTSVFCTIRP